MKYLSILILLISTLQLSAQKEEDDFFMAPEGTTLTLKKDYVIPADSFVVFLNTKGDHNNSSFSKIHLTVTPSSKWRRLKAGTVLTVKEITRQSGYNRFTMLFKNEAIFMHVEGVTDPSKLKINLLDDYFDVAFPPMEVYGMEGETVKADTLMIEPIHDTHVDSVQQHYQTTLPKE